MHNYRSPGHADPDAAGGQDPAEHKTEYDIAGRVIKRIDPLDNETTCVYGTTTSDGS